jgi:hypothetical protein
MNQHFRHQMKINSIYETGAQEWLCLDCSRRILVSWTPGFKCIVLDPGEDGAVHTGEWAGSKIGEAEAQMKIFPTHYLPGSSEIRH